MIEVKNISKSFDELKVLSNIDFLAPSGEITSILGPSGSGKTTLLRCITGLENHFSGEILISGLAQQAYLKDKRIAFVTQQYSNFSWMTVKQNIEIGLRNQRKSKADSQKIVTKLIDDLQLTGFENYYVSKLSGGMRQRVAIGRALAQDTEFLAMDEPLGALDYQTRENLQILIKNINKEYHKTILFVTHDIEEAIIISNKIIILSKLPSLKVSEYQVPIQIKDSISNDIRFDTEFLLLRKRIEEDLSKLETLNSVIASIYREQWHDLKTVNLFNHISLNQIRQKFRVQFDKKQQEEIIKHLLNEDHPTLVSLGAMLMRNIELPASLEATLWDKFENLYDFTPRYFILHEISNRTTDYDKRAKMFDFLKNNLEESLRSEQEYFTGSGYFDNKMIFNSIKTQIEDPAGDFRSQKKKWVLLISLLTVEDKDKVKNYLKEQENDEDKFVKTVVLWLLDRLDQE